MDPGLLAIGHITLAFGVWLVFIASCVQYLGAVTDLRKAFALDSEVRSLVKGASWWNVREQNRRMREVSAALTDEERLRLRGLKLHLNGWVILMGGAAFVAFATTVISVISVLDLLETYAK
jgi:hypothetical protein